MTKLHRISQEQIIVPPQHVVKEGILCGELVQVAPEDSEGKRAVITKPEALLDDSDSDEDISRAPAAHETLSVLESTTICCLNRWWKQESLLLSLTPQHRSMKKTNESTPPSLLLMINHQSLVVSPCLLHLLLQS